MTADRRTFVKKGLVTSVALLAGCTDLRSVQSRDENKDNEKSTPTPENKYSVRWKKDVAKGVTTLLTYDSDIYVGDDGELMKINTEDGSTDQSYSVKGRVQSPIFANDELLYVTSSGDWGNLYAINPKDGTKLWKYGSSYGKGNITAPAVTGDGVFFAQEFSEGFAADPNNGEILNTFNIGGDIEAPPITKNGAVYFGNEDGKVISYDISDYSNIWSSKPDSVVNSLSFGDDSLFVAGDEKIHSINPGNGSKQWTVNINKSIWSSPTVNDGVIYVPGGGLGRGSLYALDTSDGSELWRFDNADRYSAPTIFHDEVCIGSDDGFMYVLDKNEGKLNWKIDARAKIRASPVVSEESIFVGNVDGSLYRIE